VLHQARSSLLQLHLGQDTWDKEHHHQSNTQEHMALVPLLKPQINSQEGAVTRQRSIPRTSMLFEGSSEDTGLLRHHWTFSLSLGAALCGEGL
jgi:hypothetical protein